MPRAHTATLALVLLLTLAVRVNASVITVVWTGPPEDAWDAATEDVRHGGDGEVPDTDFYSHCRGRLGPFCHYFWDQGLAAGIPSGSKPPELFVDGSGRPGFGMNVFQSMPSFFIFPECKATVFVPCYSTFTPLSIDWDFEGGSGNLSPFVWLSSKGGTLIVGEDWNGQFSGSQWQNIEWIRGVYGCLYLDDPDIFCNDDFSNPYIRGMTIESAFVPEPTTLALWAMGLATAAARRRLRGRW